MCILSTLSALNSIENDYYYIEFRMDSMHMGCRPGVPHMSGKVKLRLFDRPLVAGCSIGHKPRPLHVNEWDLSQNKKINYTSNTIFQNMVLVI